MTRTITDDVTRFWGDTRLVVIDTETVINEDQLHTVSVATVTCRGGFLRGKWQTHINPGVPADEESVRIHGLTDDLLEDEATFDEIAPTLLDALTSRNGEQVVFVSHNVAFDLTALRSDLHRHGLELPDLAVIDTMGLLPSVAGVVPNSRSLADLCNSLGVVRARAHDAMYDAVMCAEATVELLDRVAATYPTMQDLIDRVSGTDTTLTVPLLDAKKLFRRRRRNIPSKHLATHTKLLPPRAGNRMLADWTEQLHECAQHRCSYLVDRVSNAGPAPARLIGPLHDGLQTRVAAGDTAGAATVLAVLVPLLAHLPPNKGRLGFRNATLAWAKKWGPQLDNLGRCQRRDQCPACRADRPCPLDTWPDLVAAIALGVPDRYARGFFETTGKEAGTGAYTAWTAKNLTKVADAAIPLCINYWNDVGQKSRAEQLAQLAWHGGCRHPDVAAAYASQVAAAGGADNLTAATKICDSALDGAGESTHDGWVRIEARRNQYAGRAQRSTVRRTGKLDKKGNEILVRRHHPETPRRSRPPRFSRAPPI